MQHLLFLSILPESQMSKIPNHSKVMIRKAAVGDHVYTGSRLAHFHFKTHNSLSFPHNFSKWTTADPVLVQNRRVVYLSGWAGTDDTQTHMFAFWLALIGHDISWVTALQSHTSISEENRALISSLNFNLDKQKQAVLTVLPTFAAVVQLNIAF